MAASTGDAAAPALLPRAVLAAGLAGAGCMAAELTAVRLMAPHFGDSAYVWTNVIGVILAALAAGAWTGGRLARHGDAVARARRVAWSAAAWLAASPWVAPWLCGWLLPADLPLDAAMPALVRGSLVATAVMFGPAMWWLGAVSPLLVAAAVRGGADVGRVAGGMSAAGTLGSLVGTFAATHALVPLLGARLTMAIAAAALVAAGLVLVGMRRGAPGAVALLLLAGAAGLLRGPLRAPLPGEELLEELQSRVQYLQVVRDATNEPARTVLRINEGLDSFHSLAVAGSAFTGGNYYDWHAVAPLLAGDGVRPDGLRALSIGDAAGTLRTVYAAVHPGAVVDAVDVDAATMALGDRHFPGPKAQGARYAVDGRVFLARTTAQWHVLHVDAYAHQVYVPAHLASREFFAVARERLLPGGLIACNVGALHRDDPVLRAIAGTMAAEFGHALAFLVPNSRNALLVARRGPPPRPEMLGGTAVDARGLSAADLEHWRALLATAATTPWLDLSGAAGDASGVLVDDRPVLDRLLAASYVDRRDAGDVVPCEGSTPVAAAELTAYTALRSRDFQAVLAAVRSSGEASRGLREYAGDARWSLRDLHSARAEYAGALALAADDTERARLQRKLDGLASELAPVERAEAAATRNGWLQGLALVVFAVLAWRAGTRG